MSSTNESNIPIFGRIYYIRHSIQGTLASLVKDFPSGLSINSSSSSSASSASATSSVSSSRRTDNRPVSHYCLCWDIRNGSIFVLPMTSFDGQSPFQGSTTNDENNTIYNVSNDKLLKYLIPINPTPPVPDRRTLTLQGPPFKHIDKKDRTFLILNPVPARSKTVWPEPHEAIFSPDDLEYINQLLVKLDEERRQAMILDFSSTITKQPSSNNSIIPCRRKVETNLIEHKKQSSCDDNDSQSSDCSVILDADLTKYEMINDWLHRYINNNCEYQEDEGKL